MPTFNKDKWNKEGPGGSAGRSNCYNYALDLPATTDTGKKLQPGEQNNHKLKHPYDCADVTEGAKKDNLDPSDAKATCAKGCWKVALFISPPNNKVGVDGDFHWYRQDDDKSWSHKMDSMDPSQDDNAGKKISDPEKADTGSYKFCNYFCVCPAEVKKKVTVAMAGPWQTPEYAVRKPAVTGIFTSGADNPSWALSEAEVAMFGGKLNELSRTEEVAEARLDENGFFVETGEGSFQIYGGVVTAPGGERFGDTRGIMAWLQDLTARKQKEIGMTYETAPGIASGGDPDKGVEMLRGKLSRSCHGNEAGAALGTDLSAIERALRKKDGTATAIACEQLLRTVRRHMGTAIHLNDALELFECVTMQIKHPFCGPSQMYADAVGFAQDFARVQAVCNYDAKLRHDGARPDTAKVQASADALLESVAGWGLPEEPQAELELMVREMSTLAVGEAADDTAGMELLADFGRLATHLEANYISVTQANFLRGYAIFGGLASWCPLPGWWKLLQVAIVIPVLIYVVFEGISAGFSHADVVKAAKEIDDYIRDSERHPKTKIRAKAKEAAKKLTKKQRRELIERLKEALEKSDKLDRTQKTDLGEAVKELEAEEADEEEAK